MSREEAMPVEETLDPEEWESMRVLGRRMVDDMVDYMRTVRERPAWLTDWGILDFGSSSRERARVPVR